jgi:hypothetical protein
VSIKDLKKLRLEIKEHSLADRDLMNDLKTQVILRLIEERLAKETVNSKIIKKTM